MPGTNALEREILLTPSDVLVATEAFSNPHNGEITAYLSAHPEATFGHIHAALQDRGVDVVKGTLSARLRNLETTGVIFGVPSPEDRGRGKVVRYSLDARRLNQLASRQLDYMLGLHDHDTLTEPVEPTAVPALRPFDTVSAKILTYLTGNDSPTPDELHQVLNESSSPQRLSDLVTIGLVTIDADNQVRLDRPAVARAARVLFEASVQ
jgi:DNA-binding MarR family transcriptional regulator